MCSGIRLVGWLGGFFFVGVAYNRDGIDFAEPAAEVDLLAAAAAEGHGLAGGGVELLFANGATDHAGDSSQFRQRSQVAFVADWRNVPSLILDERWME